MTVQPCQLRGITWAHSRGLSPLVATAQRYEELNPGVTIVWGKRSLHAFGHANVAELAESFDLIVMDHPWCGFAVDRDIFVDLRGQIDEPLFSDLRRNSVGGSFASYEYRDRLIALPIDAAAPVASFRPDLLPPADVPRTWPELLQLARGGRVIVPCFHVDLLLHLVMLAATLDGGVFTLPDRWVAADFGRQAMDMLRELFELVARPCSDWNPIAVYEQMTRGDEYLYCPFAYGYSNYARRGFARSQLRFADLVEIPGRGLLRGVLGGTGLALSARCPHREQALAYMAFVACGEVQRNIYVDSGGQPAHRAAWLDDRANLIAGGFFRDTLRSTDNAYVRPRYHGFLHFQEMAGRSLTAWLRGQASRTEVENAS